MAINTYYNSTAICHDRKISLLNRDYSLISDTQFMSCTENIVQPRTVFAAFFKNVTNYVRDDDPSKASALRAGGGTSPPHPPPINYSCRTPPPLPEFLYPPLQPSMSSLRMMSSLIKLVTVAVVASIGAQDGTKDLSSGPLVHHTRGGSSCSCQY